jgi:hypothetical protein
VLERVAACEFNGLDVHGSGINFDLLEVIEEWPECDCRLTRNGFFCQSSSPEFCSAHVVVVAWRPVRRNNRRLSESRGGGDDGRRNM